MSFKLINHLPCEDVVPVTKDADALLSICHPASLLCDVSLYGKRRDVCTFVLPNVANKLNLLVKKIYVGEGID